MYYNAAKERRSHTSKGMHIRSDKVQFLRYVCRQLQTDRQTDRLITILCIDRGAVK